jgi:hypothetical protein
MQFSEALSQASGDRATIVSGKHGLLLTMGIIHDQWVVADSDNLEKNRHTDLIFLGAVRKAVWSVRSIKQPRAQC